MSAPVPELPALEMTPKERQHSACEPEHLLTQLYAALENQDIKALEWSTDGRGVLVHTELYEEEIWKKRELLPELADVSSVVELQACLLALGFKLEEARVSSQVLLLQHPDFQRSPPSTEGPGTLRSNGSLCSKQKKKRKRSKGPKGAQDMLGQRPRRRPLYLYINLDEMELMKPAAADQFPELPQLSQLTAEAAAAAQLEDIQKIEAPGVVDNFMEVDIDGMLRHAAQVLPQLYPQYK